ncbi:hypothetical protein DXA62_06240 [Coprobacillus sp. OF03-2AA]|nr:hypothetical protein DXA62_06240 [Coprobacillus sp. OF03-2AA]
MEDEITIVLLSVLLGICIGFVLTKHPKNIKKCKNILVEDFKTTFSLENAPVFIFIGGIAMIITFIYIMLVC